jgi:hypothetical protein
MLTHFKFPAFFRRPSILVLIVLLLSLMAFSPYFSSNFNLMGDFSNTYQFFHYIYSSLYFHGEFPFWAPYSVKGLSSSIYLFVSLDPFLMVSLISGYLFGLENIKTMFLLGIFFKVSTYVLGVIVLVRHLFPGNIITALFAGILAGMGYLLITSHQHLACVIFVPLIIFLIIRFTETGNAKYLFGTAFICSMSIPGSNIARVVAQLYFYFIWFALCVVVNRKKVFSKDFLKCFKQSFFEAKNIFLMAAFLILSSAILLVADQSFLGSIYIDRPGRNYDGTADIHQFLTLGSTGLYKYLHWFSGSLGSSSAPIFMGFLASALTIFSLFYCRGIRYYNIFAIYFIFIILFTAPDVVPVAYFFYFLPGMDKVRYVVGLIPLANLLFLFLATFGFYYITRLKLNKKSVNILISIIGGMLFLYALDYLLNTSAFALSSLTGVWVSIFFIFWWSLVIIILYGISRKPHHLKNLSVILVCIVVIEIAIYRSIVIPHYSLKDPLWNQFQTPKPFVYQKIRTPKDNYPEFIKFRNEGWIDAGIMPVFLGHDPCSMTSDLVMPSIVDMVYARANGKVREGKFSLRSGYEVIGWGRQLLESSGCQRPKAYLTSNPEIVNTQEEAARAMKASINLYSKPVIIAPYFMDNKNKQCAQVESPVNVIGFSPNKIEMTVNNNSKCDGWLLYLDAYAPDWKAYIDGKETNIYRGNIGFKAVQVSPGKHNVQMKYLPMKVMWGFGVLVFLGIVGIFIVSGFLIHNSVEPLKN